MKFNIDDYKGEYAMHCKTEEEAKDFCNLGTWTPFLLRFVQID